MPHLVGSSTLDLKDADGKYFVREYLRIATTRGSGWHDFLWLNPVTQQIAEKSGYVERVGDFMADCGIYKSTDGSNSSMTRSLRNENNESRFPALTRLH